MKRSHLYCLLQKGTSMNSSLMSSGNSAAYYQESDIDKSPSGQDQLQSRLNRHQSSNQSSTQNSLLYQALFLPDKISGGTNKKGNGAISGNYCNRAPIRLSSTSSHRRSSALLDGGIVEQRESLSLSKDQLVNHSPQNFPGDSMSRSWTSSSNSLMSDGNSRLQQFGSTETFSPVANEVDQPCFEDLCQDGNEESLDGSNLVSTLPYNDVLQACSPSSVFQVLNNQCFEAAISEGTQLSTNEKYVTKMKQSRNSSPVSKGVHQSSILGNYLRQGQTDKSNNRHHHHHKHHSRRKVVDKIVANLQDKSPSSDFVAPSPLSVSSVESSSSSGTSDNKGQKKYRYNQTFSALQQSGLLKTTMRTAELLRQSRGLQQELAKLRRETSLFVECVLNNPQNKHLKEQRQLIKEQCQAR